MGFYDPSVDTTEVERPDFKKMKQQDVMGMRKEDFERVSLCVF